MKRKLLLFVIFIVFPCVTFAQSIWNNPIAGNSTASPYTAGQSYDSSINVSGIYRGPGLTPSSQNNSYSASNWATGNSIDFDDYFEFVLTPNAGNTINFSSFVYSSSVSAGTNWVAVLRSSIDNYASNIGTANRNGGTISLSGNSFQGISSAISFRLYVYNSGGSNRRFDLDDFTFNGTICLAPPTTTSATICQGDAASISATSSTAVTGNTFSGSWNAATDPTARIIRTSMQNDPVCEFRNTTRNYTATTFTVNVTGLYVFKMTDTGSFDGMAYIYRDGMTPGTCGPGWVIGDDDADGSALEPRLTTNLTAGVVYTLISTTYNGSNGTYSGNYTWNVTSPTGGQVTLSPVQWYTASVGGTAIGGGSPFNPVGSSVLPNTNTPGGPYNFYAQAEGSCTRTLATVTINPKATINAMTASICSDGNFSVTPVNGTNGTVPAGTTYSWPIPTMPAGVKGGVAGSGASVISGALTNFSTTAQNVVYTVTPLTGSCSGTPFTVTVTVNPGDVNNRITLAGSTQICNQVQEYNNLTLTAPTGNYFNNVSFASYGLPNGSCGSFTVNNSCHSTLSQSVAESYLLGNSNTVTIAASNSVFDDGCVGLEKRLYIAANYSQPICSGTVPGTISGSLPIGTVTSYLWETSTSASGVFSNAPGTNNTQNYTPTVAITQDTWFRRKVTINGCTNISGLVLVKVTPLPTITHSTTATAICAGTVSTALSYSAVTGTPTSYSIVWNSTPANSFLPVSNASLTTTPINIAIPAAANPGTYTGTLTVRNANGCTSTGTTFTVTVNPNLPASVSIAASPAGAICAGTSVTFTATPTNGGTAPTYQWYNGASLIPSATNSTYTTTGLANGDAVTVRMTSNASPCLTGSPATSNAINMTVNPNLPASVSIAASPAGAICAGTSVTFTATPTNGGSAPTYQWYNGASLIPSATNSTYTTTGLANGNTITVRMTSNASPCLTGSPATSNAINMTVNPVPTTPTANVDSNVTCSNTGTITLSALPSSGAWTIHQTGTASQNIPGTGGSTTISGLAVGTYNFTVENASGCISGQLTADITDDSSTTWNGTTWSQGLPNNSKAVIFAAPFTITADLQACSLTINSGNTVTVNPNVTLTITNAVTTNGQLIFENNSSLIQTTNATNNGYITYKRNTQPVRRYDFTYWSTPVTGADNTLHNLSPNTLLDKYYSYDAAGQKWVIKNYGNVNMEYGVGYIVRAPQSYSTTVPAIYTGSFIGTPNNGPYTIHPVSGNWNLIGNPYPSALDAEELIDVNHLAGTDVGALYFWTHNTPPSSSIGGSATNNYTSNDYAVFSLTGGVVTTSGAAQPTGYIASGQGFFAQPAGNEILFNNSMRVGGNNAQFFKTAKTSKIEKNRLWLNFTNSQGAFKQALIGYVENATNKMDTNYDAVTMASNSFVDFYSINDKDLLTIQARALPFDKADIVPLGYKTTVAGNFTIGIDHTDGFFAEQAVYLEDKKTGTIHDLRTADYTFTTAVGTFADRFVLRYTSKTLGTGDFGNIDESVLIAVKDKKVSIISTKENLKEVTIFNVGGQLVFNKKKINTTELRINDLQVADQVLMVKVTLENGHTLTKKIIFY